MQSLRGATAAGFPNWMTIIGPNTGLGNSSMILMIESQLNYMADYMRQLDVLGRPRRPLDARPAAVRRLEPPGAGADEAHGVEHRRLHQLVPGRQRPQHHRLAGHDDASSGGRRGAWTSRSTRSCAAQPRRRRHAEPRDEARARKVAAVSRPADVTCAAVRARPSPPRTHRRLRRRRPAARRGARPRGRARRRPRARLDLLHRLLGRPDPGTGRRPPGHRLRPARPRTQPREPAACSTDALADDLEAVLAATLAPGREGRARRALHGRHDDHGGVRRGRRSASTRRPSLLCSTGSSRLVAEARVVPLRAGRAADPAHPAQSSAPARRSGRSRRVAKADPQVRDDGRRFGAGRWSRRAPGSCTPARARCATRGRACWPDSISTPSVRELSVPTAVIVGTADRLTPLVHARGARRRAARTASALTELPGLGHMTPVEAPGDRHRRRSASWSPRTYAASNRASREGGAR